MVQTGVGMAARHCRTDAGFAAAIPAGTTYVSNTMLVAPLMRARRPIGALSILDRRDGRSYEDADIEPARLFAELTVTAIEVTPSSFTSVGRTGPA